MRNLGAEVNAVKLACGFAVVAAVAGSQLSRFGPDGRGLATLRPARGAALAPATPEGSRAVTGEASASARRAQIAPDAYGQFQTVVEIDGHRLPVVVDTGASFVSLTFEDADRLGFRPSPADFKYKASTANGYAAIAKIDIPEIRLGTITVRNVQAFVSDRGALSESLLGMSFLSRLSELRIDDGRLLLRQ